MTTVEQLNYKKNQREDVPPLSIIPEKIIDGPKAEKKDEFISENKIDVSNDGKFSTWQAVKNLGKGLISPIISMFSSIKGFLMGTGMMVGGALLVAATGGAILPAFLAMGIAFGVWEGAKGIHKISTAKNGDDIEKAFLDFGTATSSIGLSFLGARTSLKTAGISTEGMNNTQAVINCFKNLPESLRNSYANVKNLPGALKQDFATLKNIKQTIKEYLENYKENKKVIKSPVDEIYNEEIRLLAKRLGVSEAEIREIMPKKAVCTPPIPIIGGANIHFRKPSISINPTNTLNHARGHTIRDKVAEVIPHEVRHSEQRILPINQLTFREYWEILNTTLKEQFKNDPSHKMFIPYLQSLFRYYSKTGRKIRALKIPKTDKSKIEAINLLQSEVKLMKANSILFKDQFLNLTNSLLPVIERHQSTFKNPLLQSIVSILLKLGNQVQAELKTYPQKGQGQNAYLNAFMEVDARAYAISRKLEILLKDISHRQGKSDWQDSFRSITREFTHEVRTLDKSSFLQSNEGWLTQQLKTIRTLFKEARDQLKLDGINPNKPACKITIRPATAEEIALLKYKQRL